MTPTFPLSPELPGDLRRWWRPSLLAGVGLLAISVIGAFFSPQQFFRSYLMGYLFWIGLALGSMALVMVQHLTGGAWGVVTRRVLESAMLTLPFLAILFVPILFGITDLYGWSHSDLVARDEVMRHRAPYMNEPLFIGRAIAYFVIWIFFAYVLNRWSRREDRIGDQTRKLAMISAPGLILYVFTVTFASTDWAESLMDHWYSTIWGFLFVVSQGLTALCFAIILMALLSRRSPMSEVVRPRHFHDLGKLLLMFVMLWAYLAYSQLLIVWAGDLSDEIPWYLPRWSTSWGWVGAALIVFQFVIPFLLLLSRPLKRSPKTLSIVVGILIAMRFVDLFWIVMPNFHITGLRIHWLNITVPFAIGGMWLAVFFWQLSKRPLLPVGAPNIEQAVTHAED
ncbi:MAG: hypothetical protein LAO79_15655 [Acidobacteriia bacterium]|nr:hypothetical protein [Terriglobia bacterium]